MVTERLNVLIVGKQLPQHLMDSVEKHHRVYKLWEANDKDAWLKEIGKNIQAVLTSGNPVMGASKALIDQLPNLEIICSNGVGYDPIDIETARQRGIIVTNTPKVLNNCVADLGMALLLNVARRVSEAERYARAGKWLSQGRFGMSTSLGGKVCGIVGLGNIGKNIAKRAQAFDMDIHYYNPVAEAGLNYTRHDTLIDLARQADFLVLTLPGGEATRHIINSEVLEALGNTGYLINMARGTVVDEQALIHALSHNIIAGAGLDVFEHEPRIPDALLSMDNVVITPHIASSTQETTKAMADLVFANLTAFAQGKPVLTRVV